MQKVFVTRKLPGTALDRVRRDYEVEMWQETSPPDRDTLIEKARDKAGLLVLLTDPVDRAVIESAPGLKVISTFAVGFDNIDIAAATAAGIPVGNTPDVLTEATADLAFALLMAGARRLVEGAAVSREGRFVSWSPTLLLGKDVFGATLGIVGMGRIGRAMARRAGGFDMRVLYTEGRRPLPDEMEGATKTSLSTLLRESDFVSLHVPLTDDTRHLIDKNALTAMKKGAVLINTARGPVVDQDALVEALASGHLGFAALDVTTPEPLPIDHPLFSHPNCLIVPHLGSGTHATREKMAEMAADNLIAGLEGVRLPHPVNPEVYEKR